MKIVLNSKETIVKIVRWGNVSSGLIVNDGYRGTYVCAGQSDLAIDGFGNLAIGETKGTYTFNANGSLLVKTTSDMFVLDVDKQNGTYKPSNIVLDESIVKGKTFTARYIFACPNNEDGGAYIAVTQFIFLANGKVSVVSTSDEHDSGENQCAYDEYNPSFASKDGTIGTYSVVGTTVTVNVAGAVFSFEISDVSIVDELVCMSTSLSSETEQGFFAINTKFSIE